MFEKALDVRRRMLGEEHRDTLRTMYYAAWSRFKVQSPEAGEALHRETLALRRKALGEEHADTANSWNCVGVVCEQTGRIDEAQSNYTRAMEISRRASGDYHPSTLTYVNNLARTYITQGNHAEAEALLIGAIPTDRMGAHHPRSLTILESLIELSNRQGKTEEARVWATRLIDAERDNVELSGNDAGALNELAWLLLTVEPIDLRDPQQALQASLRSNAITDESNADYLDTLARAYHLTGNTGSAIQTQRKLLELVPADSPDRAELEQRLREYEQGGG